MYRQIINTTVVRSVVIVLLPFILSTMSYSQLSIGEWKTHLPYRKGRQVTSTDKRVYCGTRSGLYYFERGSNSVNILTKSDGLSDLEINAVAYSPGRESLIIGYANTNVDIIEGEEIFNLPDIKRKQIMGNKTINNILIVDDLAYLSCGFGIVVLNLEKKEVKDTYLIGENGSFLNVHDMATDGTRLYAATESGVYEALLNNTNLVDFNNWHKISGLPNADGEFCCVEWYGDRLYAAYRNPASVSDSLYYRDGGIWRRFGLKENNRIYHVKFSDDVLVVVTGLYATVYDDDHQEIHWISSLKPVHALYKENEGLWAADDYYGMYWSPSTGLKEFQRPDGPQSDDVSSIALSGDVLYTSAGSVEAGWESTHRWAEINILKEGMWSGTSTHEYRDLIHLSIDPADKFHVFGASFGYGIAEYRDGELTNFYDHTNSSLQLVESTNILRVGGTRFDRANNLWVTNPAVPEPISVRKQDGTWRSFNMDGKLKFDQLGRIINTYVDHNWVICPLNNGLFAFDVNGTIDDVSDDQYRKFDVVDINGKDISNNVFALAEDRENNIWVGTDEGIVVYYSPARVFEEGAFYGQQILVPRNDGTGLADILLGTEKVTAIAIDGANRKWIGTEKSGIYLISEDGLEEVHHFTEESSPLLSNNITDILIDGNDGVVYIGTDRGLISYKSTSIEGRQDYSGVYVYPNPVRHDFEGDIVITGLVGNVNVKITDIGGNIVYETTALGGQALWDGRNFDGQRVRTGVYLVFCTDEEGLQTHITKLLVIN